MAKTKKLLNTELKDIHAIDKSDSGNIAVATRTASASEVFKTVNGKEGRFAIYKKRIVSSVFLANILQSDTIIQQNTLIDNECDIIIGQISSRTGIAFTGIADTILVEDFSYVDDKGVLHSKFSSNDNDDMKYLFASCLTRLVGIIKRQIAGRSLASSIIKVYDIRWSKYKEYKTNEVSNSSDIFTSMFPYDIRKVL